MGRSAALGGGPVSAPLTAEDCEGVGRELVERANAQHQHVDTFEVAHCWGIRIEHANIVGGELDYDERVIRLNTTEHPIRQQGTCGHELGHFGLIRAGLPNTERGAKHVGGAVLMPWVQMNRHIAQTERSILKLRVLHPNASAIALAVRITQLRDTVATIIDPHGHEKPWRVHSPWIDDPRITLKVSRWERELAERAFAAGEEVRDERAPLSYALPVFDDPDAPGLDRVIVVVERTQLSLRLR